MTGSVPDQILRVDLTKRKITKDPLKEEIARKFLGGRGINAKILYDELKPGVDPLGKENIIVFGVGPAEGTLAPSSGRYNVSAKSPLTGFFGDSNSGGEWAASLRRAGYGNVVFYGKAEKPVYLLIIDDNVELRDASHIWGKDTWETEEIIRKELGESEVKVACIGPAGENLVKFACVINEKTRAAGRTGMGTVMGSKNLKAIAVLGTGGIKPADPHGLLEFAKDAQDMLSRDLFYDLYSTYGTPGLMTIYNEFGSQTHFNSKECYREEAENLYGEVFRDKFVTHDSACFSCPLNCSKVYEVKEGPYKCVGESAEYENITAFGSNCGNYDLASTLNISTLADKMGVDTISCGRSIGFVMECWEKGLITEEDTEGLEFEWGNAEAIREAVKLIAHREGFGDFLAKGVKMMSQEIPGSEDFACHIKGLETPAVDPRGMQGYGGLGYAVASRGGDHLRALAALSYSMPGKAKEYFGTGAAGDRFSTEKQAEVVKFHEEMRAIADSLDICKYITRTALLFPDVMARLIRILTGWDIDSEEVARIGERIVNVERAFNVREGLKKEDDTQPKRMLTEPISKGPSAGHVVKLEKMLDRYYDIRGWDVESGYPSREKLEELELKDVADGLEEIGKLSK